ncbi:hypothetical protein HPB48_009873 [Haemaphysalis longicornis]|uniref:Uncharacterized protein n=1 Tax=Haemaphysalis longicornis TaxID=44386 RepID=A0A9J6FVM1_HAELO|nr:hypothetical protein HPB48_009873 [Haemaphysalis longicornis]
MKEPDYIARETNRYAEQFVARHNLSQVVWKELTLKEQSVFFAIIILQVIVQKREISVCLGEAIIPRHIIFSTIL